MNPPLATYEDSTLIKLALRGQAECFAALGDHEPIACPTEPADRSFARGEAVKALHGAIARLPQTYRQVLILRDLEQHSTRETAQSLHSSVEAVKARLFRGRLMLLTSLQQSSRRGSIRTKQV